MEEKRRADPALRARSGGRPRRGWHWRCRAGGVWRLAAATASQSAAPGVGCWVVFAEQFTTWVSASLLLQSFVPSLVRSCVRYRVRSFVRSFARSFVRSFARSFVRSFAPSFLGSFVRSVGRSVGPTCA